VNRTCLACNEMQWCAVVTASVEQSHYIKGDSCLV
jgi:hypothetical protein